MAEKPLSMSQLAERVSEEVGLPKRTVKNVLDSFVDTVKTELEAGRVSGVPGVVKLTPTYTPAKKRRKGVDPFTKEERMFDAKPASARVKARVYASLHKTVRGKRTIGILKKAQG